MFRMVQINIAYSTPNRDPRVLEPAMTTLGLDWVRFCHGGWLLWTNRSIFDITERLKALLQADDQFLVTALNPHEVTGGLLPQWIWDWLNLSRDPSTGVIVAAANALAPRSGFGFQKKSGGGVSAGQPYWAAFYGNNNTGKKG